MSHEAFLVRARCSELTLQFSRKPPGKFLGCSPLLHVSPGLPSLNARLRRGYDVLSLLEIVRVSAGVSLPGASSRAQGHEATLNNQIVSQTAMSQGKLCP